MKYTFNATVAKQLVKNHEAEVLARQQKEAETLVQNVCLPRIEKRASAGHTRISFLLDTSNEVKTIIVEILSQLEFTIEAPSKEMLGNSDFIVKW